MIRLLDRPCWLLKLHWTAPPDTHTGHWLPLLRARGGGAPRDATTVHDPSGANRYSLVQPQARASAFWSKRDRSVPRPPVGQRRLQKCAGPGFLAWPGPHVAVAVAVAVAVPMRERL